MTSNKFRALLRLLMLRLSRTDWIFTIANMTLGWFIDDLRLSRLRQPEKVIMEDREAFRFFTLKLRSLLVQSGPFAGMQYPTARAAGSAMLPKLLGTYEDELHSILEEVVKQNYERVFDIGAAEGYYAVGLAMRMPNSQVFAFDTNTYAIDLCRSMARRNGVEGQIFLGLKCTSQILRDLVDGKRCLIFSDCEGFELDLFDETCVRSLWNSDVIIETHDFLIANACSTLLQRFSSSHHATIVRSTPAESKSGSSACAILSDTTESLKKRLLCEGRPCIMTWLFLRSRATV
jgi:hypothetical protein